MSPPQRGHFRWKASVIRATEAEGYPTAAAAAAGGRGGCGPLLPEQPLDLFDAVGGLLPPLRVGARGRQLFERLESGGILAPVVERDGRVVRAHRLVARDAGLQLRQLVLIHRTRLARRVGDQVLHGGNGLVLLALRE